MVTAKWLPLLIALGVFALVLVAYVILALNSDPKSSAEGELLDMVKVSFGLIIGTLAGQLSRR